MAVTWIDGFIDLFSPEKSISITELCEGVKKMKEQLELIAEHLPLNQELDKLVDEALTEARRLASAEFVYG